MYYKIKKILPKSDMYLIEGIKLMIVNLIIILVVGIISLGLFWVVYRIRQLGFPLPLPVWLVILGTGIPSCVFWFQYGKKFGSFVRQNRFTKGLLLGILGNIPGFIILYIITNSYPEMNNLSLDPEIVRIVFIIFLMLLVLMPIIVLLGTLDKSIK
ncbi:MAG: hypothetical protein GX160_05175 [Clostridiales bacterium]|nr:hypothetical protein [Clostridiales bacterium]